MHSRPFRWSGLLSPLIAMAAVAAEPGADDAVRLRLPMIFSDNMVIQRESPVPVWGWAAPGAEVELALTPTPPPGAAQTAVGATASARAGADGRWRADFAPPADPPGTLYALTVRSGGDALTIVNVVLGDVWLVGGQSNMERRLEDTDHAAEAAAGADYPLIRVFKVNDETPALEDGDDAAGRWIAYAPMTAGRLTAVGYYFARDLFERHRIPIGLIDNAMGGQPIESFMSPASYRGDAALQRYAAENDADRAAFAALPEATRQAHRDLVKNIRRRQNDLLRVVQGIPAAAAPFARPGFDDADWARMDLPGRWDPVPALNMGGFDGAVWFRRTVALPAEWVGRALTLRLGAIDDADTTFVNGHRVGAADGYQVERVYTVSAAVNDRAAMTLAVRVVDYGGGGGLYAGPMHIAPAGDAAARPVSLEGAWALRIEEGTAIPPGVAHLEADMPGLPPKWHPSVYYHTRIRPTAPYAIRGAIFYQGESNDQAQDDYYALFPAMIRDWRALWGWDFPFYWVQLPGYGNPSDKNKPPPANETGWEKIREAQHAARALPHTGEAVAIDLGDARDVHPGNKLDVGLRLARWARRDVYGEKTLDPSSPVLRDAVVDGGRIVMTFDHVGDGLSVRGPEPPGEFVVVGADGRPAWARAALLGPDRIVVSSPYVPAPVAVRYAWGAFPVVNVYNSEELPLTPFRWPGPSSAMSP